MKNAKTTKTSQVTTGGIHNYDGIFDNGVEVKVNLSELWNRAKAMPEGKEKKSFLASLNGLAGHIFSPFTQAITATSAEV